MFDEGFSLHLAGDVRTVSLNNLAVGESGVVAGIECSEAELRNKLLVMGLVRGAVVTLERVAPLGDPINITLHGFSLLLRRSEAECVRVLPK
jgi:Fe2+ transport system protein FeoA